MDKPEDSELAADIEAIVSFLVGLSERFGIPLDVDRWESEIRLLAYHLHMYGECSSPGDFVASVLEYYRDSLRFELASFFPVGRTMCLN
jgi:hypothetical protein